MNNRYIFRGKRKDNGEWIEGNLVYSQTTTRGIITEIYTLEMTYEVIPETVEQCSGVPDKNGNPENYMTEILPSILQKTVLSYDEFATYVGSRADKNSIYGWHISDLKIYDKPKELGNFWKADKCPYATESGCTYKYHCFRAGQTQRCGETLTRPPQSWCYVEEL
jgi:hypothetical protein